jgi:hypothetical protein
MEKTTIELVRELAGSQCMCGSRKRPNQTFCTRCYFRLPKEMRSALYRLISQGYEEAYEAAVKYLAEKQEEGEKDANEA